MKIHGKAERVDVMVGGKSRLTASLDDEWEGDVTVSELFVALEGSLTFVRISASDGSVNYFSMVNATVDVRWSGMPDVQSNTEWGMWASEAAGYMAFKGAYDPSKPLPEHLKQFKRVLPVKSVTGVAVPPMTKVILPPITAPISGKKAPVDSDAGGPPGLDIDSEEVLEEMKPVRVHVARERVSRDGARYLLVNSGDYPADVIRERGYVFDGKEILKVASVDPDDDSGMLAIRVVCQ